MRKQFRWGRRRLPMTSEWVCDPDRNETRAFNFHFSTASLQNILLLLLSHISLCDPIDGSPPGSSVPGILQARILEWVAISFSNAWKWKVKVKSLSHIRLLVTPWTVAYQAPPSMGFSRQEYWSGLPLPSLPKDTAPSQNTANRLYLSTDQMVRSVSR